MNKKITKFKCTMCKKMIVSKNGKSLDYFRTMGKLFCSQKCCEQWESKQK